MCIEKGLVDGKLILTDSTHIRANASRRSEIKVVVEKETSSYMKRLDDYEAAERKKLEEEGKIKPKKVTKEQDAQPSFVERTISTTDPDAGFLQRPGKPQGMHYLDHQSVDAKNGIIVDVAVTPGNVNDHIPYLDRIEYMREDIGLPIEAVGVDSAYDVGIIHQVLTDTGIDVYTPKNDEKPRYKSEFTKHDFKYTEENDEFVCPAGKILKISHIQRVEGSISRAYSTRIRDCKQCLFREKCLAPSQTRRRVYVNIFDYVFQRSHEKDESHEHKRVLTLRQIWSEGTFAAQKARHNLSRLYRCGLEAAEEHCLMAAIAINLKRMVKCMG